MGYGNPGMSFPDVALMAGQITLATEYMHKENVIFRDLKLENVVMDPKWRAKVTDFGLAKKLTSVADATTMCGSYGYAAPEIMRNTGKYTYAVDLYSFGVVMYLMFSGGSTNPKQNNNQRLPPSKHAGLVRKIDEAEKNQVQWALPHLGALGLVKTLINEDPRQRTTASQIKEHHFFTTTLSSNHGIPNVDGLLSLASETAVQPDCAGSIAARKQQA